MSTRIWLFLGDFRLNIFKTEVSISPYSWSSQAVLAPSPPWPSWHNRLPCAKRPSQDIPAPNTLSCLHHPHLFTLISWICALVSSLVSPILGEAAILNHRTPPPTPAGWPSGCVYSCPHTSLLSLPVKGALKTCRHFTENETQTIITWEPCTSRRLADLHPPCRWAFLLLSTLTKPCPATGPLHLLFSFPGMFFHLSAPNSVF